MYYSILYEIVRVRVQSRDLGSPSTNSHPPIRARGELVVSALPGARSHRPRKGCLTFLLLLVLLLLMLVLVVAVVVVLVILVVIPVLLFVTSSSASRRRAFAVVGVL